MTTRATPTEQLWIQTLDPSVYARPWFDTSGFADGLAAEFAGLDGEDIDRLKPALLAAAKHQLAHGRELIRARFFEDNDGALYIGAHALMMDALLRGVFERITRLMPTDKDSPDLALMATGGYGRGELAPASDIDLLFLTSVQVDKPTSMMIEAMLYILWDLGLTVGHATRSLRQQLKSAKEDITIRTAFLEARFLAGDAVLAETMLARFDDDIVKGTKVAFLNAKLDEREQRLHRIGNQRYVVEPNIKDGKGGLRDLHTLFWIARYAYRAKSMTAVMNSGILSRSELRSFSYAQRFLWSVRIHLHLRAGREDDRLTFDAQMDIAPLLGFHNRSGMKGVERFMRRYHLAAKTVGNLTRIFWAAIAEDFVTKPRSLMERFLPSKVSKPFSVEAGRINLPRDVSFREHPGLMMGMFRLSQKTGLDLHPNMLRKLHGHLKLVDGEFRDNPEYNAEFLEIISSKDSPERVLRLMNESGFIGKFLPDFGRIVAMMQFDMYHSYTVDEHTIFAMGILNGIESGRLKEIAPVASEAVHQITLRQELYIALLLHDIAKGRGGDHSILGAEVARTVCPRFGLSDDQTEIVSWLVRHHLLMSETAFRYDLNDPVTIEKFAAEVQSPERLNLLLVLTVADIRAVGPNVWNGWKAALMRDLYTRTMAVLTGTSPDNALHEIRGQNMTVLFERLKADEASGWTEQEIDAHLNIFYPSYWTSFDADSYERHASLCRQHLQSAELLTVGMTPDLKRNATELVIITDDDAGLFSRIAGGVAALGAYIVDARITTRKDGLTVDVLWIQDQDRQAITKASDLKAIKSGLKDALTGMLDINAATERRNRQTPSRIRRITAPARVLINNNASDTHTVVEINGKDAPGLLYKVTRKMAELGLQIQTASVSTYGDRVVDVFYVKDTFGLKISSETRLNNLQRDLLTVLKDSDPANQVAA
ncbi:MAG: [protein-PII] uridylyltransferase [Alphaproteobacteria bacterium]|nr:[protein-PII] uridylyltransferase [Alphaproteobacteria bacterium]